MRGGLVLAAGLILFVLGLAKYGVPPLRPVVKRQAETASDVATLAAPGKLIVTSNNGAPENDLKRRAEQALLSRLFEQAHPDATLVYSTWQFSPESFLARYMGGTLTDVVGVYATEAAKLLDLKMSADITEQVRAWHLYPQLNLELLEPMMRDGRIYGMSRVQGFYVMLLFYNRDLFRKAGLIDETGEPTPPQTWDDFTTMAQRLTDREQGVAGFGILGETGGNGWHFLNWAWQAGGDFERRLPDGRWISTFHEPPVVSALQFVKDLRWEHDVLQRNVLAGNDELFQMFSGGRIAMGIFTMEYLEQLVDRYGMPLEKIGVALLPAGPAGRANQIGGAFNLVNPRLDGLHKQRAFDSIALEADLDVIEERMRLLNEQGRRVGVPAVPVFKPEYQAKVDAILDKYRNLPARRQLMQQAAEAARFEPPMESQVLYRDYLGPAIQEVLVDPDADPASLLQNASRRFQQRVLEPIKDATREGRPDTP